MSDDQSKKAPGAKQIHVDEDNELAYWTKELGVSAGVLCDLVDKHGANADDVRKAINK